MQAPFIDIEFGRQTKHTVHARQDLCHVFWQALTENESHSQLPEYLLAVVIDMRAELVHVDVHDFVDTHPLSFSNEDSQPG